MARRRARFRRHFRSDIDERGERERELVTSNWMSARSEVAFKIAASLIRSRHLIPGIVPALEISPPRIRTGRVNICVREKNFPRARWTRRKESSKEAPLKEGVYRFVVLRFYKGRR